MTTETEQTRDRFHTATGRSLDEWMEFLCTHREGAEDLHDLTDRDMVRLAVEGGASDWWAQSISVEVERSIGRRSIGHTSAGSVSTGASTGKVRKTRFAAAHDKLGSLEDRDAIKAHWRAVFNDFAERVEK